ncbi:MAG: hypothetical protein R3C14_26215 [Caldilineaceae bacterium]
MSTHVSRIAMFLAPAALLLLACQPIQPVANAGTGTGAADQSAEQAVTAAKIESAMSAGPPVVAENATIIDWPTAPGGEQAILREGSNTWTCMPDWPATPDNDPMCLDETWAAWMQAFMAGEEPVITKLGISYMLAGGAAASNTDPFATEPAPGENWVVPPPHVMLIAPGGFDAAYFGTDYISGKPWIMWDDTPYEFLIIPTTPATAPTGPVAMSDSVDAKIANIMGAAPQVIVDEATMMDWPAAPGGEQAQLRAGGAEWLCVPDWPATPPNDPMCFDPSWTAWMGSFMAGEAPDVTTLGVSYMLSGGAFADNTDPTAMEPPTGKDWVVPPPHVMLIAPGGFAAADFGTDYTSGLPWIVWDETPYEFLVIPVE